jgi:Flp pilus assembly protein TadG
MIGTVFRRRLRREDGASLVEFALILPILALLLFGLIDFGFIYNDYLQVRQGVRDGARQGAVANFGSVTPGCNTSFMPGSSSTSTQARSLICTTRSLIGLDQNKVRVAVCAATNAATTCSTPTVPDPAYAAGNKMVVCAIYPATSRSGFLRQFLNNGVVTTRVVIRVEQTANTGSGGVTPDNFTTVQEDLTGGAGFPTGKNWNFCTPTD